jgi:hypothetical protein
MTSSARYVPGNGRYMTPGRLPIQESQSDEAFRITIEGLVADMKREDTETVFRNSRK